MTRTIFVLGMGRSGTSTVAGILRNLGVEFGSEDLMMPAQPTDNIRGFWEFLPLYEINVEIMSRLGGNWFLPPKFNPGWEKQDDFADLRAKAREIIAGHFQTTEVWGFKDPRSCLTMPFWRLVIDNPIECVFTFRNPLEVANSLLRRDSFPLDQGILLWLLNVVESWHATQDLRRHFLFYEDILKDPVTEIGRLERFLGKACSDREQTMAMDFVGQELRHELFSLEDLLSHPGISPLVKALYANLRLFVDRQKQGYDRELPAMNRMMAKGRQFAGALTSCGKPDSKLLSTYQPPPPSGR